jgi:hypothetical protein
MRAEKKRAQREREREGDLEWLSRGVLAWFSPYLSQSFNLIWMDSRPVEIDN